MNIESVRWLCYADESTAQETYQMMKAAQLGGPGKVELRHNPNVASGWWVVTYNIICGTSHDLSRVYSIPRCSDADSWFPYQGSELLDHNTQASRLIESFDVLANVESLSKVAQEMGSSYYRARPNVTCKEEANKRLKELEAEEERIEESSPSEGLKNQMDAQELTRQYKAGKRDFSGVDLSQVDLSDTDLQGIDLSGANLTYSNLSYARLFGANLSGANLSHARLSSHELGAVYLEGANLSKADLREASMFMVDLSGVDLSGANLSGANLTGVNLEGANLEGAIMPGDKKRNEAREEPESVATSGEVVQKSEKKWWQFWKS